MRRQCSVLSIVVVVALAAGGCSKDPETAKRRYLASGDRFATDGRYAEAVVQYGNAVQQDPKSGEARFKLGGVLEKTGDLRRALPEYIRAADLLPQDAKAQVKAGEILLLARRFEDAKARADKALSVAPKQVEALTLKANALAGLKNLESALDELEKAVELDPSRSATYANLGVLQAAQGNAAASEAAFKRAIATDPAATPPRLALGAYYWSSRQPALAEEQFKAAHAINPKHPLANRALALLYMTTGRETEAEPYYRAMTEALPDGVGQLMLADYLVATKRPDEARQLLVSASAHERSFAAAKLKLARLPSAQRDRAGMLRLIDEVLAKQPTNLDALIAKAGWLTEERRLSEAQTELAKAVAQAPDAPQVQFAMGRLKMLQHDRVSAIAAFNEVLKKVPGHATTEFELARLHLNAGRLNEANHFAVNAVRHAPSRFESKLLLANVSRQAGNLKMAEDAVKALTASYPDSPAVQVEAGLLAVAQKKRAEARRIFDRVIAEDPQNVEAVVSLAVMDIQDKQPGEATKKLHTAMQGNPRDLRLILLAASTYASLKAYDDAEKILRRAMEVDPNNPQSYLMLGRLYAERGQLAEATAEFEKLLARQPKSVPAGTTLGILLELQKRVPEARARYEATLAVEPNAAVAANNLAWIYAERGENLDVALQLAQTAKARMPERPEVNDTLGWVYYKKGLRPQAVAALTEAVRSSPKTATYHYHLGMVHAAEGDTADARAALKTALALAPDFPGAADAKLALAKLGS